LQEITILKVEKEQEYILTLNKELNVNGRYLKIDNVSYIIFGFSSSINILDFLKINKELKRLNPESNYSLYNLESFDKWNNSYNEIENSKCIFIFKNADLLYYKLNTNIK